MTETPSNDGDWKRELEKIYATPGESGAFSSAEKLFRLLKDKGYGNVSRKEVQDWLDNTYTYAVHRARSLNFPRNPTLAENIDHIWQADLLFLPELSNYNDRKPCMLVCIDVISRHAWGESMRDKTGPSTAKAFEKILIRSSPRKPQRLHTDKGSEFYNKHFKEVLRNHDIELYSTESDKKAAIAERCIKEIKKLIYRYLTTNQVNRYIDVLPKIFLTYNRTFHSSLKMAPADVKPENLKTVLNNLYGSLWDKDAVPLFKSRPKAKFSVGDKVRVALDAGTFRKGYKGFWTTEIYIVETVKHHYPYVKYRLKDKDGDILKGLFYEQQLQRVKTGSERFTDVNILQRKKIKGKDFVLVSWKNESPHLKRWIPISQLH